MAIVIEVLGGVRASLGARVSGGPSRSCRWGMVLGVTHLILDGLGQFSPFVRRGRTFCPQQSYQSCIRKGGCKEAKGARLDTGGCGEPDGSPPVERERQWTTIYPRGARRPESGPTMYSRAWSRAVRLQPTPRLVLLFRYGKCLPRLAHEVSACRGSNPPPCTPHWQPHRR